MIALPNKCVFLQGKKKMHLLLASRYLLLKFRSFTVKQFIQ